MGSPGPCAYTMGGSMGKQVGACVSPQLPINYRSGNIHPRARMRAHALPFGGSMDLVCRWTCRAARLDYPGTLESTAHYGTAQYASISRTSSGPRAESPSVPPLLDLATPKGTIVPR